MSTAWNSAGFSRIQMLVAALVFSVGVVGVMPLIAGAASGDVRRPRQPAWRRGLVWYKPPQSCGGWQAALAEAVGGDVDHLHRFGRHHRSVWCRSMRPWEVALAGGHLPPHRGRRAPRVCVWPSGSSSGPSYRGSVPRGRTAAEDASVTLAGDGRSRCGSRRSRAACAAGECHPWLGRLPPRRARPATCRQRLRAAPHPTADDLFNAGAGAATGRRWPGLTVQIFPLIVPDTARLLPRR